MIEEKIVKRVNPTPFPVIPIVSKGEIELISNLIYHYSSTRVSRKLGGSIINPKLIVLLAFYFKFGYSTKTKRMAADSLGVVLVTIHSYNNLLKELGYLVEDEDNKRDKFLAKELRHLQAYYKKCSEKGEDINFVVKLSVKI